jgi:hypothetical protein
MMANIYDMADTWNAGGTTFTAIKMNVTDTASATGSLLMDLQVGSASMFAVEKSGNLLGPLSWIIAPATAGNGSLNLRARNDSTRTGLDISASGQQFSYFIASSSNPYMRLGTTALDLRSGVALNWAAGSDVNTLDIGLKRIAAGVLGITNGGSGAGALQFTEQTAPAAGSTNTVRLYAEDNGSGKTRLMAIFPTGAAQQVAIEP